ncbi:MAG: hypothetical protein QUS14_05540 [Pyrinomonadaceae bacterium]|nr:hypothetical protein [Pyrinomonadaceae bacterium]
MRIFPIRFLTIVFASVFVFALSADAFGQGKGKGGSSGGGKGSGSVSQTKSSSRSDDGKIWDDRDDKNGKNNKAKGGKKNDDGLVGRDNRYKGLSKKLGMSPEEVRDWYEREKRRNPNLNYGRFVAANMISKNAKKNVSADDILDGLRRGDSIGQVLQRSGWKEREIRDERYRIRRVMQDEGYDYVDRAADWVLKRR